MKKNIIALFLMVLVILPGCEKDDICPEESATTPLLIITFHDPNDPETLKQVQSLSIVGEGRENPFLERSVTDSVAIPLRVFDNTSVFAFILNTEVENEDEEEEGTTILQNADTLTFRYATEQEFISRACGFITTFSELTGSRDQEDEDNWISSLEIVNPTVQHQNTTHVKIYH